MNETRTTRSFSYKLALPQYILHKLNNMMIIIHFELSQPEWNRLELKPYFVIF